ncbi:MAG: type II secretion system GspH family protein, partial [Lentisphaeraceae bacterium]|nr:type II secretion system GspH family protein [Lentisphaeraceae bacterium]
MTRKKQRFTLIELLVVVAILGILISMILPSLSRARAMALASLCISNEKQVGIAITMYQDENDERFPPRNHNIHAIY